MPKVNNIADALNEATRLLILPSYQTEAQLSTISRIFLAQALVLVLSQRYRLSYIEIGAGIGVDEKTIRMWLQGNHNPTLEHVIALSAFYEQTRLRFPRLSRISEQRSTVVRRLKSAKGALGMSDRKLADLIGVNFSTIARWFRGEMLPIETRVPKIVEVLIELEKRLGKVEPAINNATP